MSDSAFSPFNAAPGSVPGASPKFNNVVGMVRMFMRDFPHLNRTIEGEESDDRMIAWALMDTISDWNTTPPLLSNVGVDNFPSVDLLIRGAVIALLDTLILLQARNHLTYSDGGTSVSIDDKAPLLLQIKGMMKAEYEQKKKALKTAINIQRSLNRGTGIGSEYFFVNGYYGYW